MNILFITPLALPNPTTKGGAVENLIQMLIDQNEESKLHNFSICTIWDEKAEHIAAKYKCCHYHFIKYYNFLKYIDSFMNMTLSLLLKKNPAGWKLLWKIFSVFYIKRILKENTYDCVVVENSPFFLRLFKDHKLNKKYGNKLFFHAHNDYRSLYGTEEIIKKCKVVFTISEYIKMSLGKQVGVSLKNAVNLYNCANHNMFNKNRYNRIGIRTKLGFSDDDIVVVFSGRLTEEKGFLEGIKAISLIENRNIKLLLIGGYFYKDNIKNPYQEKIDDYKNSIGDRLIVTGYVDYADIPQYYRAADIALVPALWNEPACMSLVESMTMGLPFVTTNVGGIPEYADSKGGIILEKDGSLVDNIKKSIIKLAEDVDLRNEMGRYNEEKYKNYDEKFYYNRFCDIVSLFLKGY